jgi:hypothetical protein
MTSSKKRSLAAKRANKTRQIRHKQTLALDHRYGSMTAAIVMSAVREDKNSLDNLREWYGRGTVAAVLANFTRGCYSDLLTN